MAGRKVLFTASVTKTHILHFHLPFIKWFSENGYDVHTASGDDLGSEDVREIPFCSRWIPVSFSRSPFDMKNIRAYREMKALIDSEGYDLIICNTPIAAFITRLAAADARKRGTKVIYTCHGFHFYKGAPLSARVFYIAERIAAPLTDCIITINREDECAAGKMGCTSFLVHGLGVDTKAIMTGDGNRYALREEYDIPQDAFLLMSLSEINRNKNITAAVEAFAQACGKRRDMYYIAVGSGDSFDSCKALAERLGFADRVIFTGYKYDGAELLCMADAFIFPSYREGLGLAAIEAMAAGLPLIASDIRGVREYAVNGENSLLYAPSDIEGFASAISRLADDPALRKKLGAAGRITAGKFDMERSFKEITDIYRIYAGMEDGEPECRETAVR